MEQPPPYNPQQGYAPPQQGYPPPQQGYPPPQQGYPPPQQGYPPPQQGYPPPQQQQPIMIMNNQAQAAPAPQTIVVTSQHVQQKRGVNHLLHFLISLFFWPWLIVWLCLCIFE